MNISKAAFWFFVLWIGGSAGVTSGIPLLYIVLGTVLMGTIFLFVGVWSSHQIWFWYAVICVWVIGGAVYTTIISHPANSLTFHAYHEEQTIQGTVNSNPRTMQAMQSFILETDSGNKLFIQAPIVYAVSYGDTVEVSGTVEKLATTTQYLAREGVVGSINFARINAYQKANYFSLLRELYALRETISQSINRSFSGDSAALANGLLLGQQSANFSAVFKKDMQQSGTTHLVALSGYNIAIVIQVLYGIVAWWMSRKKSFVVVMSGVVLFVLMTGAESSVVRAAIMGSLLLVAERLSRVYDFKQAMAATAWVMTIRNPSMAIFDIGFVLSFVSLWGLAYIAPVIQNSMQHIPHIPEWLIQASAQTIGAQIAVAPLLFLWFGGISWTGIITNIILLPLVPVVMGLVSVVAILGIVSTPLGWLGSFSVAPILAFFTNIIHVGAQGGMAHVVISGETVLVSYVILLWIGIWYKHKRKHDRVEIRL